MKTLKPIHGIVLVGVVAALFFFSSDFFHAREHERVRVAPDGGTRISVADLDREQVRFYQYVSTGSQEVRFFVGRDKNGQIQVGFDANELCAKFERGYQWQSGWLVCKKCDKNFHLEETNADRGGCFPVALKHRLDGDTVVLAQNDLLEGWRFFR